MVSIIGASLILADKLSQAQTLLSQEPAFLQTAWILQFPPISWICLQTGACGGAYGTLAKFQWYSQLLADKFTHSGTLFFRSLLLVGNFHVLDSKTLTIVAQLLKCEGGLTPLILGFVGIS